MRPFHSWTYGLATSGNARLLQRGGRFRFFPEMGLTGTVKSDWLPPMTATTFFSEQRHQPSIASMVASVVEPTTPGFDRCYVSNLLAGQTKPPFRW